MDAVSLTVQCILVICPLNIMTNTALCITTSYAIIWSAIFFIGYEMYSIYSFVKAYERTEYAESNEEGRTRGTKAKKVAIQAGLFVGALYLTWFFTTVGHNMFSVDCIIFVPSFLHLFSQRPPSWQEFTTT